MIRSHIAKPRLPCAPRPIARLITVIGLAAASAALIVTSAHAAEPDAVAAGFQRMLDHSPSSARPPTPAGEPADPLLQAMVLPLRQRASDSSAPALARQLHERAIAAFAERRYAQAYGHFAAAADLGQRDAASVALVMVQHGPVLFGSSWSATGKQLERWSELSRRSLHERMSAIGDHDRGE